MIQITIKDEQFRECRRWLNENVGLGCKAWTFEFPYHRHDWSWDDMFGRTVISLPEADAVAFKLKFGL